MNANPYDPPQGQDDLEESAEKSGGRSFWPVPSFVFAGSGVVCMIMGLGLSVMTVIPPGDQIVTALSATFFVMGILFFVAAYHRAQHERWDR